MEKRSFLKLFEYPKCILIIFFEIVIKIYFFCVSVSVMYSQCPIIGEIYPQFIEKKGYIEIKVIHLNYKVQNGKFICTLTLYINIFILKEIFWKFQSLLLSSFDDFEYINEFQSIIISLKILYNWTINSTQGHILRLVK